MYLLYAILEAMLCKSCVAGDSHSKFRTNGLYYRTRESSGDFRLEENVDANESLPRKGGSYEKTNNSFSYPMLSTHCESVQICTDPDRNSRIFCELTSQKTVLKLELVE